MSTGPPEGGYAWENIRTTVASLKGRLGFGDTIEFLHLVVDDSGKITFVHPATGEKSVVKDEMLRDQVYKVLYHHGLSRETVAVPAHLEKYTRISLLDDSMHMSCSTNQHRIEASFLRLVESRGDWFDELVVKHFGARPVDRGDKAWRVPLLPAVPAMFVYNIGELEGEGEDEALGGTMDGGSGEGSRLDYLIPSTLNIFFEKNALKYLPSDTRMLRVPEVLEDVFLRVINGFFLD